MKRVCKIIIPLLLAVLLIASTVWYFTKYDPALTQSLLLNQARRLEYGGNHRLASWFYELAYGQSQQDPQIAMELAARYRMQGNYTKAEYTLTNAMSNGSTAELYIALCKLYIEQDKLQDAVSMLDTVTDPAIKAELDAMRPSAPTADHEPGFYSQYISVSLTADSGTLYATTDGQYPSTGKPAYSEPFTLPGGETTIYALSVGDNGLVSPITILGYTVGGVIEPAVFTDPAVETAVREALEVSEDKRLYTNDLWKITSFTVPEAASSCDDLALLPYLEDLTISTACFEDVRFLSNLAYLKKLDISGCSVSADDLTVIAQRSGLTELRLSNCGLSNISNLAAAQNLTVLDLSSNAIRDIEALSALMDLNTLDLSSNALNSLSALSALGELTALNVSGNTLSSLAPVATCLKLTTLNASHNQLTTLAGLDNLPQLTRLELGNNRLEDAAALAVCTQLTYLDLSDNALTDLSALETLNALQMLDFSYNEVTLLPTLKKDCALTIINGSYNQLSDLEALTDLENLNYVYMDYNEAIETADPLAECPLLVQVSIYGTSVRDVSALTAHDILVNYNPLPDADIPETDVEE